MKLLTPHIDPATVVPLYLSCASLPLFGVWSAQSGIARSYNWVNLGLSPALIYASSFAISLILCVVMIPRFGLAGAAAASSIARWCSSP